MFIFDYKKLIGFAGWGFFLISLIVNALLLAGKGVTISAVPTVNTNVHQSQEQKQSQTSVSIVITASDVRQTGDITDTGYLKVNSIEEYVLAREKLGTMSIFSYPVYFKVTKNYDFYFFSINTTAGYDTYLVYPLTRARGGM